MQTNSSPAPQPGSGSNRRLIIGIVVVLLLCCCLAVTGVAGYYVYQGYVAAQQAVEDLQNIEIPTGIPFDPSDPSSEGIPGFDVSGQAPEGGLADDETRLTAWFSVQVIAAISGCNSPTVEGTTITVLQQPDASGVWKEEWNVNCGDGTFQRFNLTFTPQNGFTNVDVEMPAP
jgi:hypothetical protein